MNPQKLINDYKTGLATPDCSPGSGWYRVVITFDADLAEFLPILNADLEGADYYQSSGILLWKQEGYSYSFQAKEVIVSRVNDKDEAAQVAEETVGLINEVWSRRDAIEPDFEGRALLPDVLSIFKLLPNSNCRECGHVTCMAFAAALRKDVSLLCKCRYLPLDEFKNLPGS